MKFLTRRQLYAVLIIILSLLAGLVWVVTQKQYNYSDQEWGPIFNSPQQAVFEPVLPDNPVRLPDGFRFHPEFQNERWRFIANLTDKNGEKYGVQWTFFRIATDERVATGWRNPQLYSAHVVVASKDHVWREQRLARGGIGQAGLTPRPFRLWMDNWNWRSMGQSPLPGILNVKTDTFALNLTSSASGPFILGGDNGYIRKHDLLPLASYGVQAPFINVAGELYLGGKAVEVSGTAWIDKEWGSELNDLQPENSATFLLNVGPTASLYVQSVKMENHVPYTYGTYSDKSGRVISLEGEQIQIQPKEFFVLSSGKVIPLTWSVEVPGLGINVTTTPLNREQWQPFIVKYWGGTVESVNDPNIHGYMQLTGY